MGWILIFFPRRRNNDSAPTASPDITQSHPFSLIIILSVIFSMFLLPTASFASGWTTNGDALYNSNISGYSWAQTTFILMCISTVISVLLFPAILSLFTFIHKKHGFSSKMQKVSFGFLICIILQIILIFIALLTFTIGFENSDLQKQSLGFCVYLTWVAFGLYTIGGIAWFIYIWKYFHDYDKDYDTGKCKNCN